jgi:hypothetical protein
MARRGMSIGDAEWRLWRDGSNFTTDFDLMYRRVR